MAKQNESQLNALNQRLRGDPQYQQFLQSIGVQTNVAPNTPWRLSGGQREQAKQWVRQHYPGSISGNLQIDPSGNINQDEGFSKYAKDWKTYAAIGGGLTGVGALGYGPMAGLFGGGAAGAGGGAGAASSLIPNSGGALTAGLSGAAPAVASQGVSAGMGLGAGALGSGVTLGESAGTGLAGTAAGAGGPRSLLSGLGHELSDPNNLASIAAVVGGLLNNRNNSQGSEDLHRIQQIQETQMRRADPLHQVAVNLAFGRAPLKYREGVSLNNAPLPR